jgi:prepilin-type N-terminal cleavage/methylation domain-containing protein
MRMKSDPAGVGVRGSSTGFTLIELLLVVLIISFLASIAIPRLDEVRARAHYTTIGQDFRQLGASQERYYQTNFQYAPNLADLDFSASSGVEVEVTEATNDGWAAVGTHVALEENRGCSIYVGSAMAPPLPNGDPHTLGVGVVQCAR